MRLVTLRREDRSQTVGVLLGEDRVLDLVTASGGMPEFRSMLSLIAGGEASLEAARQLAEAPAPHSVRDLSRSQMLAPIPLPPRMRACSLDPKHLVQAKAGFAKLLGQAPASAETSGGGVPRAEAGWYESPVYWAMDQYCVSGPDEHVTWPAYSDWIDYELEIAAVIGTCGRDVPKARAHEYIFGYTILNDLSARDAQLTAMATGLTLTAKGKDFTGSYPMGPCIVTRDEIEHDDMDAVLRVNGEEWGRGTPKGRHWTFEDAIAYCSMADDLIPGEILSSATVANCCGVENARKGARGDCVEMEVRGIGVLRTWID